MSILNSINNPQDIKRLSVKELEELAKEIREFIIKVVADKGGHLASSLGAVELCIALHYCLESPEDTIIFDVGHQCYAHKILTGRKTSFLNLREYKGLSGFPSIEESIYDTYTSGHASTALSWATGIAEAKRLQNINSKTVVVIGDGSLTGGMCFEALNNCGHQQADVLVILNHNEMSISASVGALSSYLTKLISMPVYNRIKRELEDFIKKLPLFSDWIIATARRFEEAIKGLIVPGIFFEELGFRYFGPLEGHNLGGLITALKNIINLEGPRLLHIITKKGKGYKFAEDNPESFHSASKFKIETGEFISKHKCSFSEVLGNKLVTLGKKDDKIVAITAAMAKGTGLEIFKEVFPERFFDVGIAEEHAVGFASGLARQGLKPYVAIYSTFIQRAFDQIIHDVALQNLEVVFCLDRAGLVGEDGPTHHGVFDIAFLRIIPNMVCMAPKDREELEEMLEFALELKYPSAIRYPKSMAYSLKKEEKLSLGKAEVLDEGKDICIIALGSMVKEAIRVRELLSKENIGVFLVNARFIKPLDNELLDFIGNNFRIVFTVEEGILAGGFGSAVWEYYEHKGYGDKLRIVRLGIPDEFTTFASREQLLRMYGLDSMSMSEKVKKIFQRDYVQEKR